MAFVVSAFEALLADLRASGREPLGVAAALDRRGAGMSGLAALRHDVDRLPFRAENMARLEHGLGVRATYYFRCDRSGAFPEAAIRGIAGIGHEIGYHHETLSAHRGDVARAVEAFARNLADLRRIAPVRTVAQHGAPLSPHDNQQLMETVDLAALDLVDAVTAFDFCDPVYLTDTGGRWNAPGALNRRDRIGSASGVPDPSDRSGFRRFLAESGRLVYVSAHPERWASSLPGYLQAEIADVGVNLAKRVLAAARRGAR